MQASWPFCRYIPRNPFISCRRSLDVVETIRYTWNQLARSAGKWVKGLTVPKQQREREREERTQSRCSLRNDSTIAWSIFLSLSLSFSVTRNVLFPFFVFSLYLCLCIHFCFYVSSYLLFARAFFVFSCAYGMFVLPPPSLSVSLVLFN